MPNIADTIEDIIITRELVLKRVTNSLINNVTKAYTDILDDIEFKIRNAKVIDISNMNKIIGEIKESVTPLNLQKDLSQLAQKESNFIITATNTAVGADIFSRVVKESTINNIAKTSLVEGATIKSWFKSLDNSTKLDLERQIKLAVTIGENNQEINSRVRQVFKTNTNSAKTITRTAISTISNQTRQLVYEANDDVIKGYKHSSILDGRTSFVCAGRDGGIWNTQGKPINSIARKYNFRRPPIHWNCRSLFIPILKSFKELGVDMRNEIPKRTRSSLDGAIPSDTTFSSWIKTKSTKTQESFFGKGRYKLFEDGKINISDLVNQQGYTIPIKDLI